MILRPPRSTRTDTLFPYTTLFRSHRCRAERTLARNTITDFPIGLDSDTNGRVGAFSLSDKSAPGPEPACLHPAIDNLVELHDIYRSPTRHCRTPIFWVQTFFLRDRKRVVSGKRLSVI